jgi:hypothetical protein
MSSTLHIVSFFTKYHCFPSRDDFREGANFALFTGMQFSIAPGRMIWHLTDLTGTDTELNWTGLLVVFLGSSK